MLKYRLLHPELLSVLAQAGHGSRILLADANYPVATGGEHSANRSGDCHRRRPAIRQSVAYDRGGAARRGMRDLLYNLLS